MAVAPAVFVVFERADKTPIWILLRRRAFFTSRSPFGCNPPCTDSQKSCMGGRERETFLCTFSSPYSHLSLSFFLALPRLSYPSCHTFFPSFSIPVSVSFLFLSLSPFLSPCLHPLFRLVSPPHCLSLVLLPISFSLFLHPHSASYPLTLFIVTSPYFSLSLCLFV